MKALTPSRTRLGTWLVVVLLLQVALTTRAAEPPESPKPTSRTTRQIEGWTVRVDDRLLSPPNDALGTQALRFLEHKLSDIRAVVAPEPLAKLQAVTVVLDLHHGKLRSMQYHPSAEWLQENGYAPDLAKCVHIPEAADLPTPRNITEQPWVVLHELAHAYHDQVLGFDDPRILQAYERFKKSGHGDAALLFNGSRVRHYGLTDQKEFFAEMTEAYFGENDFFPFNRAELLTAEPELFELLRTIWGPLAGKAARPAGDTQLTPRPSAKTATAVGHAKPGANGPEALPSGNGRLTVDRIFGKVEFKTQDWGAGRWLKDGSGYTALEKSATVKDAKDVVRYAPESGQREVLLGASNLLVRGRSKPLKIEDYALSDDGGKLLLFTDTKRVWRKETRGDYWVFDLKRRELQQLGGKAAPSTLMFATFSPDGRRVAYVCENNLFVQNLENLRITQLTADGSATIINGTSDWAYEEELGLRVGFRWSPDGKYIAYWQFDTAGVGEFKLLNNTDTLYPKVTAYAYPKVGETNSACRVGVVRASGGKTRWLRPSADPRNHYIPGMEWSEDSRQVLFQQLSRLQNTNQVFRANARSGDLQVLLTDRDAAWVEAANYWRWIEHGRRFLWLSERDGWRHLYAVTSTNQEMTRLTPGAFDVIHVAGVDEQLGWVYFIASPDNPTQRYLYRSPLDGRGAVERVSPQDQPGSHSYELSPEGRWAFHTYSRFGQPPVVELVRLPEHQPVRVLADNARLRAKCAELKACPGEFFRVGLDDGVQLDAWCLKPPDFDPAKKYPLLLHVYGEPAGSTVQDSWGGDTYLWHCLLAQRGYVVMSIDNRGTAAPRGRDWRKSIYRQVGILASADQAEATRQILKDRPYLDPQRVGIWGWSGGGSMSLNAIFRYPDLYRTAMAIAFISNQRFYDSIYQERYMGLPADNEAGFKNGSPIAFAHQLKGHLLLVHGTADDNCHYQNCEVLINELIKQNKQFSLMSYPNLTHAIREGDNTKRHLFETLTRYLTENLPTTP